MYFAEVFRQRLLYMGDCVYCVLCAVWRGIRHIRKCTTLHSFHFPHHIFFLQIHSRRRSSSSLRCSVEWRSILRYHTRFTIYTETRYREEGVGDGLRGWELCVYFENFKVFFPRVIRRRLYVFFFSVLHITNVRGMPSSYRNMCVRLLRATTTTTTTENIRIWINGEFVRCYRLYTQTFFNIFFLVRVDEIGTQWIYMTAREDNRV